MKEEIAEKLRELKKYIANIIKNEQAIAVIDWDFKISTPSKAVESRAKVVSYLFDEQFKLITSDKVKEFIGFFEPVLVDLSDVDKAIIRNLKKEYYRINKIPQDKYKAFNEVAIKSQQAWEEAKEKDNYKIFEPYLKKMVEFQREFAEYYGYKDNKYDALLDIYEDGLTVKKLDKIFGELKAGIVDLLKYIKSSNVVISKDFLEGNFDIEKQKELSEYLLDVIKFDKKAGILAETEHPFTLNIGNKDVRIATHYYKNLLLSNLFSIIHEGGHALYEQHIPDELVYTGIGCGVSMAVHESQSRYMENIVGRSKPFLKVILPKIKQIFPQLQNVTLDNFYKSVNYVKPSLIRTEADELTYNLHIIIRYEIEKELINGNIEVDDLPEIWNKKYKEYLGIEPKNYRDGILQDMHWSDGSFGYFPSYALGNIYDGQFLHQLLKENPKAINNIENGDLSYIINWLKDNIHKYGAIYTPNELVKKVTGEELNAEYFLNYLNKKYKLIY